MTVAVEAAVSAPKATIVITSTITKNARPLTMGAWPMTAPGVMAAIARITCATVIRPVVHRNGIRIARMHVMPITAAISTARMRNAD